MRFALITVAALVFYLAALCQSGDNAHARRRTGSRRGQPG